MLTQHPGSFLFRRLMTPSLGLGERPFRRAVRRPPSLVLSTPRRGCRRVRATRARPRPSMRNSGVGPRDGTLRCTHARVGPVCGHQRTHARTHARTWTATGIGNPRWWVARTCPAEMAAARLQLQLVSSCVRADACAYQLCLIREARDGCMGQTEVKVNLAPIGSYRLSPSLTPYSLFQQEEARGTLESRLALSLNQGCMNGLQ